MTLLLGALGWGLLTFGAVTHLWHHRRLRQLLAMHVDHEAPLATALTAAEAGLAVTIPAAYLAEASALRWFALAAAGLALGFVLWITRLLLTNSDLPCACSFAEAPTTVWSLTRASCTVFVGLFATIDTFEQHVPTTLASFAVGLALAGAVFLLPDAISWPSTSRAVLHRIDAHQPSDPLGVTR